MNTKGKTLILAFVIVSVSSGIGCGGGTTVAFAAGMGTAPQTCPNPAGGAPLDCTLTFSDTFNKGVVDSTKWSNSYVFTQTWATDRPFWTPDGFDFSVSNGLKLRVDNRTTNFPNGWAGTCTTTGGVTTCTSCPSVTVPAPCKKLYTAPALTTNGSFYQAYGYFEMTAQLPEGPGMFPAFWAYAQNAATSSELDVVEGNNLDNVNHATSWLDWAWYYGKNHVLGDSAEYDKMVSPGPTWPLFDPAAGLHTYAMAWTPDNIAFLIDGTVYSHYDNNNANVPADPVYLLFDADVGGPGGPPNASTAYPAWMNVQSVQVYQYNSQITTPTGNAIPFTWADPATHQRPTVSPQTVNPGDTIAIDDLTVLNGPNQTAYSVTTTGMNAGYGPHLNIGFKDYNGVSTFNNKGFDVPAPMAPGTSFTVPISVANGTQIALSSTLTPGVYGIYSIAYYNTANTGGSGAGYAQIQVGDALARFTVVPATYPILNLNSSPLVFSVTPGKLSNGSWRFSGAANQAIGISGDSTGDALNLWLSAPYSFTVSPSTMLEFDFSSTDTTDAVNYCIGLFPSGGSGEYTQTNADKYLFQLSGDRALGEQSFNHYVNTDGTTHYVIPVGNYYTGVMENLTLSTVGTANAANAIFSNIRFYDLSPSGSLSEP